MLLTWNGDEVLAVLPDSVIFIVLPPIEWQDSNFCSCPPFSFDAIETAML